MKLYTEEQVIRAILSAYLQGIERHPEYRPIEQSILQSLFPIQLPSDEEIEEASPYVPRDAHDYYFGDKQGFIDGAKWMRDKIKGGDK